MAINRVRRSTRRPEPVVAHENDDLFAAPPPVVLPTEEEVRERIEAVAGRRYRTERKQLYAYLAALNTDTHRSVLLAVLREYQMQRRVPGRQRQHARRSVSEPRIDPATYHKERERLEALLRKIEEHPLVYHFCRAHMVQYPKDEAICPSHERWTKWCSGCHGFGGPRVGHPRDARRHRLLEAIVPAVRNTKGGTLDMGLRFVAAICRCFPGRQVALSALRKQWHLADRERRKQEKALAAFLNTVTPFSQVREMWTPQLPDESTCLCHRQGL